MSTNNFNLFILFFIIYCRTITLAFNDFKFDYGGGTRVYDQTPPKNTKYYGSPKQERSTSSSSYGQAINFGQNGQQIRDGRFWSLLDNAPNYLVGCVIQKRLCLVWWAFRLKNGIIV